MSAPIGRTTLTIQALLHELEGAGTTRRFAGYCPIGHALNELAREPSSLSEAMDLARQQTQVFAQAEGRDCFKLKSCATCKLGQDLFGEYLRLQHELHLMPADAQRFWRLYGASGDGRTFPQNCATGKALTSLIVLREEGTSRSADGVTLTDTARAAQEALAAVDQATGCTQYASCLACPSGQAIAREDLLSLTSDGGDLDWEEHRLPR